MEVLDEAITRYPEIRAVVMTGFGGVSEAVTAMKRGAIDFLIKPFQLQQLSRVLSASIDQQRLREENAELRAQLRDRFRFDNIIGRDSTMQQLFSTLELIAPMNSTVLIHGETGTGKELIARTIHHHSPRADQKFVAFNSAAIPEGLAEAELFGHVKGAFTGAISIARRTLRAGPPRHALHRRSRVDVAAAAGQAAARAAGARGRARRRFEADEARHPHRRRNQHATCARWSRKARSARTSSTA